MNDTGNYTQEVGQADYPALNETGKLIKVATSNVIRVTNEYYY